MHNKKLDSIIAQHDLWLQSGGAEGQQARLDGADLRQADLRNVDLSHAALTGANLERAELAGAILRNTDLRNVNLGYASLVGADLSGANLQHAAAMGADLTDACLIEAILLGIQVDYAQIRNANLTGALARKAQFYRCDMTGSKFDRADLRGANLTHANLTSASFADASIEDVALQGALFTAEQGHFLATAQSLQNLTDDDLSVEEKQINSARKRFLRNILYIQKTSIWIATIGIAVTILAGAFDIYSLTAQGTMRLEPGFNYTAALTIILISAFSTTLAAFLRLRTLEGVRASRPGAQITGQSQTVNESMKSDLQMTATQINGTK